jgi:Domain of unknown function (DUF4411)
MTYILDTNIFIQAKNEYYGFDLCPGFWDWLEQQNQAGKVFSIDSVKAELVRGTDDLSKWAKKQGSKFFLPFDQAASLEMQGVSTWVQNGSYRDDVKRTFLSVADPMLIAYAKAHNHTVVSHEVLIVGEQKKIKIPAVCNALNVPYIRTFDMLRQQGASFVLP